MLSACRGFSALLATAITFGLYWTSHNPPTKWQLFTKSSARNFQNINDGRNTALTRQQCKLPDAPLDMLFSILTLSRQQRLPRTLLRDRSRSRSMAESWTQYRCERHQRPRTRRFCLYHLAARQPTQHNEPDREMDDRSMALAYACAPRPAVSRHRESV